METTGRTSKTFEPVKIRVDRTPRKHARYNLPVLRPSMSRATLARVLDYSRVC